MTEHTHNILSKQHDDIVWRCLILLVRIQVYLAPVTYIKNLKNKKLSEYLYLHAWWFYYQNHTFCHSFIFFTSVQSSRSVKSDSVTRWTAARQASLSSTNSQGLLKLMSIESVMPFSHLILCRPLQLLPLIFPSIKVFSNESVLGIRWSKYWSFSFSISPFNGYSGLISFRMNWLDLLAVQGTLKSLLQHHSSKAWILWHSAFFIVQLSHPYMTTKKKHSFD